MIYPSIDKLLLLVDSKYRLVHIAAKRSNEMSETNHLQPRIYISLNDVTLEEINDGLITIKYNN